MTKEEDEITKRYHTRTELNVYIVIFDTPDNK